MNRKSLGSLNGGIVVLWPLVITFVTSVIPTVLFCTLSFEHLSYSVTDLHESSREGLYVHL